MRILEGKGGQSPFQPKKKRAEFRSLRVLHTGGCSLYALVYKFVNVCYACLLVYSARVIVSD